MINCRKVVDLAKSTLEKVFTQRFVESSEGSYLPLSVYEKQGYDIEQISKQCNDFMEHPVLGRVYRVVILAKASQK